MKLEINLDEKTKKEPFADYPAKETARNSRADYIRLRALKLTDAEFFTRACEKSGCKTLEEFFLRSARGAAKQLFIVSNDASEKRTEAAFAKLKKEGKKVNPTKLAGLSETTYRAAMRWLERWHPEELSRTSSRAAAKEIAASEPTVLPIKKQAPKATTASAPRAKPRAKARKRG